MRNKGLRLQIIKRFESQSDFAVAAGCDDTMVSKVVNGRRQLSPEQQKEWSELLNCSINIFKD